MNLPQGLDLCSEAGKRNAEEAIEKPVNAKKQKKDIEEVPKGKNNGKPKKAMNVPPPKKKSETSSSDDTNSSDSEEEVWLHTYLTASLTTHRLVIG